MTYTTTGSPPTLTMALSDLHEWPLNPRRGIYRRMESLMESIREIGIQEPLMVWFHVGQWWVLQGNRRRWCAEQLALAEVPVIVADCADEAAALRLVLCTQIETDGFDPVEEAVGIRSMVTLGQTGEEIARDLNRPAAWVQLRLDILRLPDEAKDALALGRMDTECVPLLMKIETGEERLKAVQALLIPECDVEPLRGARALQMLREVWIARDEARRDWLGKTVPKLRKKFRASDGYSLIEDFHASEQFAAAHGHPMPGYRFADEMIDRKELLDEKVMMTWGDLARVHEAAVYVVCAWKHADGFVLVVNERALRDAEAVAGENGGKVVLKGKARGGNAETRRRGDAETRRGEGDQYDTENRDNVVCPHCGYEHQDSWNVLPEILNGSTDHDCLSCGERMVVTKMCTITYTTRKAERA